jgi:hypothetical protein
MTTRLFCFAPYGGYFAVHHQLDAILALALRAKGGASMILGCNGLYADCEAIVHVPQEKKCLDCQLCASKGKQLLTLGNQPFVSINDLVTSDEIALAEAWSKQQLPQDYADACYKGYALGQWSLSSLLTTFQISAKELTRPDLVPFYQSLLRNAVLTSIAIERVLEHFQPSVALVFNGRFSQYRTAFEILRATGLRVITHERGFSDNSFIFYNNSTFSEPTEFMTLAQPWMQVPLQPAQVQRVQQYLSAREHGKEMNIPILYSFSTNELAVRRLLGVSGERLFGFFSSTETEMAQSEEVGLSNTQLPLLKALLEYFRTAACGTLIIRHHPNLAGDAKHPPEYVFISELYRALIDAPPCVRSIMPTEELSSYALFWHLSGAIVPFSSVGTEIASRGVCSLASRRGALAMAQAMEFDRWQDVDLAQVVPQLLALSEQLPLEILKKNYRFLYAFIERASVRFNSVGIKDHYQPDISSEILQDIQQDRDPSLRRIVDGLLDNTSVYPMPSAEELVFSPTDEESLLEVARGKILEKRRAIYEESLRQVAPTAKVLLLEGSPRRSPYPIVFAERYPHVEKQEFVTQENRDVLLHQLSSSIAASQAELVAICHPSGSFDGNFITEGVDLLSASSGMQRMLLRGVWLGDTTGLLFDEFLSKIKPGYDRQMLERAFPDQPSILRLLSFGFYQRDFLLEVLDKLIALPEQALQIESLLAIWASQSCLVRTRQCGIALL